MWHLYCCFILLSFRSFRVRNTTWHKIWILAKLVNAVRPLDKLARFFSFCRSMFYPLIGPGSVAIRPLRSSSTARSRSHATHTHTRPKWAMGENARLEIMSIWVIESNYDAAHNTTISNVGRGRFDYQRMSSEWRGNRQYIHNIFCVYAACMVLYAGFRFNEIRMGTRECATKYFYARGV